MTEKPKLTGISPEGLPVFELKINQPNWYKVDTTKLKTINDVGLLLSSLSMKISTDCEKFDKVKHLLDIPEPRKSLEEISKELDEKFEKLIERTHLQYRIGHDWTYTLRKYNQFCKDQDADFEYAKRNGYFKPKLKFVSNTELSVNNTTTSFEIRCGTNNAGYYTIGSGNVRYYMNKKPNWWVRNCAKIFFDFTWKDTP
jgi:hypothetical protein